MNEPEIKALVGKRIREFRHKNKLSQFALGEKVDINQRQIALIEAGKSFPSLVTLNKLANVFNCQIKDIFENNHLKEELVLRKELIEVIKNFTPEKLRLCYKLVKDIEEL